MRQKYGWLLVVSSGLIIVSWLFLNQTPAQAVSDSNIGAAPSSENIGQQTSNDPKHSEHFYTKNNILFYDPTGQFDSNLTLASLNCFNSFQNGATIPGGDNLERIYNFLTTTPFKKNDNQPMSPMLAAAVMGNMYQESGYNPALVNPGGSASGLTQMMGERLKRMKQVAAEMGVEWQKVEPQLIFLQRELDGDYGNDTEARLFEKFNYSTKQSGFESCEQEWDFKNSPNIEYATKAFRCIYERPFDKHANDSRRIRGAQAALKRFGQSNSSSLLESDTCQESASEFSDGFQVFHQDDKSRDWSRKRYAGGTILTHGCGIASMVSILNSFNIRASFDDVIQLARTSGAEVNGAGTAGGVLAQAAARKYPIKTSTIPKSINSFNQVLRNGGVIYVSGNNYGAPFSNGGHFVVIYGFAKDGSGKWLVGQVAKAMSHPNDKAGWDPNYIINAPMRTIIGVYKK